MKSKNKKSFAQEFSDAVCDNEEIMGEGAAYRVTCEQFGIDPDSGEGYELLASLAEKLDGKNESRKNQSV